jgi:hypothetical protein
VYIRNINNAFDLIINRADAITGIPLKQLLGIYLKFMTVDDLEVLYLEI